MKLHGPRLGTKMSASALAYKAENVDAASLISALYAELFYVASAILNVFCLNCCRIDYELCTACKTAAHTIRYFKIVLLE